MKVRSIVRFSIVVLAIICTLLFVTSSGLIAYAEGDNDSTLPSRYSLRDDYVVFAQHQDGLGYCWNFAATTALSTTIMKATGEYYDFSELWAGVALNVALDTHSPFGMGGYIGDQYNAMKKSGLMLECDFPYTNAYTVSDDNASDYYNFFERYSNDDLVKNVVYDSTTRFTTKDVEKIKNHIYNHGSVYLTFTFRQGFVESEGAHYLPPNQTNTNSNHAISVIGWDDDFTREVFINNSTTPSIYKGAWMVLNSYTEKGGVDGISYVFYEDSNIGTISGYKYETDVSGDFYFHDKIESGYAYPTNAIGKYYGDFTAQEGTTKQKNIFYNDVFLEYSYTASEGVDVKDINIYLGGQDVTDSFAVNVNNETKRFFINKNNAPYGQYKVLVTYGNEDKEDVYLNNFFVTHGIIGEEIEFDYENNVLGYNSGLDLEYFSTAKNEKNYVIYTNQLSGEVAFIPTKQSVYSEKDTSIPKISYDIKDGTNITTYTIKANTGYDLNYNFIFEYSDDETAQPVNVYYDLRGGINNEKNYSKELASPTQGLTLYAPTRRGYTFAGWYLDYNNGSKKVSEVDGVYRVNWDDIHHMGEEPPVYAKSYYKNYYLNSNTLFVYARWEEEVYHDVDITINGEGSSNVKEKISVTSSDTVRYLLIPNKKWCLYKLTVNGKNIEGDEFVEAVKYGLVISDVTENISINATFENGVYLALSFGENVKNAYIVGTKDGVDKEFYNGDFIPNEYFESLRFPGISITDKELFEPFYKDFPLYKDLPSGDFDDLRVPIIDSLVPSFPNLIPAFGTRFNLVVEVFDDEDGYTYVLDDAVNYTALEKGKFQKQIAIDDDDGIKEINVGNATKTLIEPVDVVYSVGSYVEDHYISSDIQATSGAKLTATYDAGQVVYLFIKKPSDTAIYYYTVPSEFVNVGNQWYRLAICVNASYPNLGKITISRAIQSYTVTWKNWDGSVIYTEDYRYGSRPIFDNQKSEIKDRPIRPDDEIYSYVFSSWDKELVAVKGDVTYTAVYEKILREYTITIEDTENGKITPNGSDTITALDKYVYIFTPDNGYKVKDVIVNGQSIGAVEYYIFENVIANQTLKVEFEKIIYEINVTSGDNGKSTPSLTVESGGSVKVEFSPKFGYQVKDVIIDGVSIGKVNSYTFVSMDANHTVAVEYELNGALIAIIVICGSLFIAIIVVIILAILEIRKNGNLARWVRKLHKSSTQNEQ